MIIVIIMIIMIIMIMIITIMIIIIVIIKIVIMIIITIVVTMIIIIIAVVSATRGSMDSDEGSPCQAGKAAASIAGRVMGQNAAVAGDDPEQVELDLVETWNAGDVFPS